MKRTNLAQISILAAAMVSANALAFEFDKPITTYVPITKANPKAAITTDSPKKEITLMNIKLSAKEQKALMSYQVKPSRTLKTDSMPLRVNLGMNGVPVLDQGRHGSCVTFAITGAIDAALGRGDYVSQLCSLALGRYLEDKTYIPSGWNGSIGPWVLDQTMRFGIVSKEAQREHGCGNLKEYPVKERIESEPMTVEDFSRLSENVNEDVYPVPSMNFAQRFDAHFSDTDYVNTVLEQVKNALHKGSRVTIGTFLVLSPYCSAGACASYHATNDTWALTKEIETPPFRMGGHEMIIIAYDDTAVAIDSEGKQHRGLLTLRNSWGEEVGDQGNYYMTYDYFKKFAGEVQEIYVSNIVL